MSDSTEEYTYSSGLPSVVQMNMREHPRFASEMDLQVLSSIFACWYRDCCYRIIWYSLIILFRFMGWSRSIFWIWLLQWSFGFLTLVGSSQTHMNALRSRTGTEGPLMELVVLGGPSVPVRRRSALWPSELRVSRNGHIPIILFPFYSGLPPVFDLAVVQSKMRGYHIQILGIMI